jgi:2-keto-4-pentenoate hydratase
VIWDHLYWPAPCSSWPVDLLRVVGTIYREAAGQGIDQAERLRMTVAAYVAAGGEPASADRAVQDMLASLSMERGDWLWGPAQGFTDQQRAVAADAPFEERE